MKEKIKKILEKPRKVIPLALILALGIGLIVFKTVGFAPKKGFENLNNQKTEMADRISQEFQEGDQINLAFPKSGRVEKIYVHPWTPVQKGQVLANLESADAKGALLVAEANYQKIVNGATGPDIEVAKATVHTAEVNLENVKNQQDLAVKSAHDNLLNSTPEAIPINGSSDYHAPLISGNYNLGKEGTIKIHFYRGSGGVSFDVSGLVSGTGVGSATIPQPIGNSGLYLKLLEENSFDLADWTITIPNQKATNYLANFNAYQSALETKNRLVSLAEAGLSQAQSALVLKQSNARPEDVSAARGALEVAQGVYNNNFIYAPTDGVISVINVNPGEIAIMNQTVIKMIVKTNK